MQPHDLFTYRTFWSEPDREFVGLCAELPSLSWLGASHQQALAGIKKIVRDVLLDMTKTGETVPEPIATKRFSGELRVRLPPNLHRQLAIRAAEAETSLNRILIDDLSGRSWGGKTGRRSAKKMGPRPARKRAGRAA